MQAAAIVHEIRRMNVLITADDREQLVELAQAVVALAQRDDSKSGYDAGRHRLGRARLVLLVVAVRPLRATWRRCGRRCLERGHAV